MKTMMPSWLTRQATSAAEFAERVEDAKRDIVKLTAEKQAAQVAYDAAPSPKGEDALLAADESLRRGQVRLESAERALAGAKQAEAEQACKVLLGREQELEAILSPRSLSEQREPGAREEVKAVLAVVDVHTRRLRLELQLLEQDNELSRVRAQLGKSGAPTINGIEPDRVAVATMLADHLHSLTQDDIARPFLQAVLFNVFGGIPVMWSPPGHNGRQAAE